MDHDIRRLTNGCWGADGGRFAPRSHANPDPGSFPLRSGPIARHASTLLCQASSGKDGATFLTTLSLRAGSPLTRRAVTQALEHCYKRMGVERLDLVHLCWCVRL